MGNICGGHNKRHEEHNGGNLLQDHRHPAAAAQEPRARAAAPADGIYAAAGSPVRDQARGWSDEHPATSERVAAVKAARSQGGPVPAGAPAGAAGLGYEGSRQDAGDPEWLSSMLRLMWPHLASASEKMLWQMLPDMLQQSKPTWVTKLELKRFVLGDDAPYISNVRAANGTDPAVPDIHLEADVHWATDKTDIELEVNPLPKFVTSLPGLKQLTTFTVGVEDISIQGRIHISMSPLLDEVPVVGALQISFLDVPRLSWDLTISGGADPLLDAFEPWLMSFVEDSIMSSYVYPGHYFYPLQQGIPDMQSAAGVLEVEVLEAQEVPKMDYFQNSSPFCKVWLTGAQAKAKQTEVVDYTKNPAWSKNNRFGLTVHSPEHQDLVLVLLDSDYGSADDEIGRVHLHLSELQPGKTLDRWFGFTEQQHDQQERGGQGKQQKRSLGQKALMAVVPTANQQSKHLADCRIHIRATYHPLAEGDVKRLHQAAKSERPQQLDMVKEPTLRQLVQRYGLLDQLTTIKAAQQDNQNQNSSTTTAAGSGTTTGSSNSTRQQAVQQAAVAKAVVPRQQDTRVYADQAVRMQPMLVSGAARPAGVSVVPLSPRG